MRRRRTSSSPTGNPIKVDVRVTPVDRNTLGGMTEEALARGCKTLEAGVETTLEALDGNLVHCDRILFDITLRLPKPAELWIFYVDAEYGVHVGFPKGGLAVGNLVEAGGSKTGVRIFGPLCTLCKDKRKRTYLSFGRERVFVVAVEKKPERHVDLRYLAQPSLSAAERGSRLATRGEQSAVAGLTELLFSGAKTRGRAGKALRERIWIKEVGWTLWPHQAIAGVAGAEK